MIEKQQVFVQAHMFHIYFLCSFLLHREICVYLYFSMYYGIQELTKKGEWFLSAYQSGGKKKNGVIPHCLLYENGHAWSQYEIHQYFINTDDIEVIVVYNMIHMNA